LYPPEGPLQASTRSAEVSARSAKGMPSSCNRRLGRIARAKCPIAHPKEMEGEDAEAAPLSFSSEARRDKDIGCGPQLYSLGAAFSRKAASEQAAPSLGSTSPARRDFFPRALLTSGATV
jgi:hypothetical protein